MQVAAAMPRAAYQRMLPYLEQVQLEYGQVLYEPKRDQYVQITRSAQLPVERERRIVVASMALHEA